MTTHGHSELYEDGIVAQSGDVAASCAGAGAAAPSTLADAVRQIETLRSINAQLVRQVEQLRQREAQAQSLADRDGLTGLYNRRKMFEVLRAALTDATHRGHRVGVLFIDLDGFKGVNDHNGHAAGDKLLSIVASRIASRARHGDTVCRYGGDEFIVILPRVADLADVQLVAASIARRVALPYRIDGAELKVTAAIGVAVYPDHADNVEALMHRADEDMYRAKAGWNPTQDGLRRLSAPTRRRDDAGKRRLHPP